MEAKVRSEETKINRSKGTKATKKQKNGEKKKKRQEQKREEYEPVKGRRRIGKYTTAGTRKGRTAAAAD
ncbi:hypothetical protein Ahy_A08g038463 isoform D [Arachis hypogaea]|uniref:Uncharacterized protein n=1 Tax=Arachis hypogaea TaxID=3818 RepID=A0A445BTH4_ARAHY|nr:hypothetical protein Ahy_A08g038463 isoform D [Arachis hypogaea]